MPLRSAQRYTTPSRLPPLTVEWQAETLPRRTIRNTGRSQALSFGMTAPPHVVTGAPDQPFDFCGHIRRLCAEITQRCEELRHIDVSRILFTVTQARNGRGHGLQARVTPMRFRNGERTRRHRGGRFYQVQSYILDGREVLYVMTFCLPRFLNQDFDEKLVTIFHELYHIGPGFDGDLRRHHGRYQIHTHSQKRYDELMAHLAREYLAGGADPNLHAFLRLNFTQLRQKHGAVLGVVVPRPRLVPVWAPTEY